MPSSMSIVRRPRSTGRAASAGRAEPSSSAASSSAPRRHSSSARLYTAGSASPNTPSALARSITSRQIRSASVNCPMSISDAARPARTRTSSPTSPARRAAVLGALRDTAAPRRTPRRRQRAARACGTPRRAPPPGSARRSRRSARRAGTAKAAPPRASPRSRHHWSSPPASGSPLRALPPVVVHRSAARISSASGSNAYSDKVTGSPLGPSRGFLERVQRTRPRAGPELRCSSPASTQPPRGVARVSGRASGTSCRKRSARLAISDLSTSVARGSSGSSWSSHSTVARSTGPAKTESRAQQAGRTRSERAVRPGHGGLHGDVPLRRRPGRPLLGQVEGGRRRIGGAVWAVLRRAPRGPARLVTRRVARLVVAQRLLTRLAATRVERAEHVVEAFGELPGREHPEPRRGELYRQRQTVEPIHHPLEISGDSAGDG